MKNIFAFIALPTGAAVVCTFGLMAISAAGMKAFAARKAGRIL